MKYCTRCLMPDTKFGLTFDRDGVCAACRTHERKKNALDGIDWQERGDAFEILVDEARAVRAPYYDALVPVSGGKDSLTQLHRLLERGLRVLAMNVDYGIKTDVGRKNLELVPRMGANLFIFRPDLRLHRRLVRIGFEDYGDPDLMSHVLLYAAPLHTALRFSIPLVLLGENAAFEYGGDQRVAEHDGVNERWFLHCVTNSGVDAPAISRRYGIPMENLRMYEYPGELAGSATRVRFMGSYFRWDSEEHLRIARTHGFETLPGSSEGTYRTYVGIDEKINRIHQYMKVLKLGYGRATDHACEDIRAGRLTREQARPLVRRHDLEPLSSYYVDDFLEFIGMDRERFDEVMESYRNRDVWHQGADGNWEIRGHLED
ncbi:MAG: N-acetyl sugar amidotransferase [Desulfovibrionaceae bacterium]